MLVSILRFLCLVGLTSAFSTQPHQLQNHPIVLSASKEKHQEDTSGSNLLPAPFFKNSVAATTAAIGLSLLLLSPVEPAWATSKTAAQISLESLPPTTVSLQVQDLPVIGNLLSGTYTRVDNPKTINSASSSSNPKPSIVVKSPQDKIGAIKSVVTGGHIEFDVSGLISTHLDVDIAAEEAGVAKVRVASNLIPVLPYKNAAATSTPTTTSKGKKSSWNVVTNMGSGESYYYNDETGVSQRERPTI